MSKHGAGYTDVHARRLGSFRILCCEVLHAGQGWPVGTQVGTAGWTVLTQMWSQEREVHVYKLYVPGPSPARPACALLEPERVACKPQRADTKQTADGSIALLKLLDECLQRGCAASRARQTY